MKIAMGRMGVAATLPELSEGTLLISAGLHAASHDFSG